MSVDAREMFGGLVPDGDMARLAGILRPLVQGERDADRLTDGMGPDGEKLVLLILQELARLDTH